MSLFENKVEIPSLERQVSENSQDSFVSDYCYDGETSEENDDDYIEGLQENKEKHSSDATIVSLSDVLRCFIKEAKQCSHMCGISEALAMTMLRSASFDKDAVISEYFDGITKDHGGGMKAAMSQVTCGLSANDKVDVNTCFICSDDAVKNEDFISLGCDHFYCCNCWEHYLDSKITEGQVFGIRCMSPDCNMILGCSDVERICQGDILDKYYKFIAQKVVTENKRYIFCPAQGCEAISELNLIRVRNSMECGSCGYSFCLKCHEETHEPASCEEYRRWTKLNACESMNTTWLSAFTKECPKCLKPIEKNGGCNHMTCVQCRYEFCWLCRQNWRSHSECHVFKASVGVSEEREKLERYLHFYTRYMDHGKSVANQSALMSRLLQKGAEMEKTTVIKGVQPSQYLSKGLKAAVFAHKILRFTYVHAYYMENEDEQRLFEYQQGELESAVVKLLNMLEHCPEACIDINNAAEVAIKQAQHILDAGTTGVFDIVKSRTRIA